MEEAIKQIQSQMQVVLDQLRTLSDRTDSHGNTLQRAGNLFNIGGAVQEIQQKIQQLNHNQQANAAEAPRQRERSLIHHKDAKLDDFKGDALKFRDWVDDAIAYVDLQDTTIGKILQDIATNPKDFDLESLELSMEKERWEDVNRQVYAFLRQRLKDEAQLWFQTQENSAGLPAWKAISCAQAKP